MIDITFRNVKKSYGANVILENLNFEIGNNERVGLIGKNGAGKSTIFKIIKKMEEFEEGSVNLRKDIKVGYLKQVPPVTENMTAKEFAMTAFLKVYKIKEEMRNLEKKMTEISENELELVMKKYGELQVEFEHLEGYEIEEKFERVYKGLKIDENLKHRNFEELSGGEKARVMLTKILLESPDVILLDEPTNHLDIEAVEWLEGYINDYEGSVMIISHDRYFMDRCIDRILELEDGQVEEYKGNYSWYLKEKDLRFERRMEEYKAQQKKIKKMEEAIKRFRLWGEIADNEFMFKKAKAMEKRIERMDKKEKPKSSKDLKAQFMKSERSGKEVVIIDEVSKSFGQKQLFEDFSMTVEYGDRLCVLGHNGSGKTTLMKLITNEEKVTSGEVRLGSRVKLGYLEQDLEFENDDKSMLEAFSRKFGLPFGEVRKILARYMFTGEDTFKTVKNLSGGEKSRLRIAMLMQEGINFLVMDEPTNHLDIGSREYLEGVINNFKGTVMFVSHDRYFINKMADRVVEISKGEVTLFEGNYEYYKKQKSKIEEVEEKTVLKKKEEKKSTVKVETEKEEKKMSINKKRKIKELEEKISLKELELKNIEKEMNLNGENYETLTYLMEKKQQIENKIETYTEQWCNLNE